ncbi:amino acid permease [Candidatus Woesearchaeota archaeon]|nr:amino acid permease [Candidatus Woesearchaeota archaeon]
MRYEKKCCTLQTEPKLKRSLGFWQASICGIGIILGAGIYALIGIGAGSAGPALWLSFLIAGIIATLTGLSYAELSSIFRKDAAEYDYVEKAFSKKLAWFISLMMIFAAIFTAAAVAIGFGGYLKSLTGIPILLGAIFLIFMVTLVNLWGIKESAFFNTIFTLIEASGLFFIIFLGMKYWGNVNLLEMPNGFGGVLQAGALVFFSYIGFEAIVKLTEETKNPTKTIPKAIVFSVLVSTLIYVLVAVSALSVISWESLNASNAPLAEVAKQALGGHTFLILALIALCSTLNTVLMDVVTTSRQVYGMANKKVLPSFLGKIGKTKTPYHAILAVSAFVLFFLAIHDLERIASIANFFTFITFALINFSVIALRKKYPVKRPFRISGSIFGIPILPLLGGILSLGMLYYVFLGVI